MCPELVIKWEDGKVTWEHAVAMGKHMGAACRDARVHKQIPAGFVNVVEGDTSGRLQVA